MKSKGVKGIKLGKDDVLASACAVSKDVSAVLFATSTGLLKRVKVEDIQVGNRPVKGSLIAKRVKSNPNKITFVMPISAYDELKFYDPEEHLLRASDIPLKTTDTTFSNPISLKKNWYLLKGIEECRIIDRPEGLTIEDEEVHDDVEKLSLFDEETE